MRISDWSSDVCSSDLQHAGHQEQEIGGEPLQLHREDGPDVLDQKGEGGGGIGAGGIGDVPFAPVQPQQEKGGGEQQADARVEQRDEKLRSEEHTSELQSLMRISYAVFCLKKKKITKNQ